MTREELALIIWKEQIARGMGESGETVNPDHLNEWFNNRSYPLEVLDAAANGDLEALAAVRAEAGLPLFV